ncbi:MAG: hypothetical protein IPM79_25360 [Polyangiaceae bacterium]|nr:hypothetical protein [Polyangiaceae bacterium]
MKLVATAKGIDACPRGKEPGFEDLEKRLFGRPREAPFLQKGVALPYPAEHALKMQYVKHGRASRDQPSRR